MYRYHVNVFAGPKESSFACTWEDAATMLQRLPRMTFEPDGSFILSGDADGTRWQVDGHLFDFSGRLHRMELHGTCPPEAFDALLSCIGWPEQKLTFAMVREGMTLDERAFRTQAMK